MVDLADQKKESIEPWLFRVAATMTFMTFPLIWVGGLVTTYDAGMAVPDWPNTFGYNLLLYPISTWIAGPFDLFVEHGHRLLGIVVGMLAIALVAVAHFRERRAWMKLWTWFILAAVIGQGVLGGVRVLMDERTFAMIHGCTGPLFFALAMGTTVMMTRWWQFADSNLGIDKRLLLWSSLLLVAAICQLVIGAQLRHIQVWFRPVTFTFFVHLHLTFAVILTILILAVGWLSGSPAVASSKVVVRVSQILIALLGIQITLGIATWIFNYALPWQELNRWLAIYRIDARGWRESLVITGHQAMGSLIIGCATILVCTVFRLKRVRL